VVQFANLLKVDDKEQHVAIINPLLIDEVTTKHIPPCHLMVCGNDPLRDHALLYKKKLDQNG
jgi:acetyl esterase/lipase